MSLPAVGAMIAFVVVSAVIGSALAGAGGWRKLAERYPARMAGTSGERFRFTSLRTSGGLVGMATYNSCVTVGVGEEGVSLELWAPFRLFHPPLFIPWSAVEHWRVVPYPPGELTQIRVKADVSLSIGGRAGAAIADHAGRRGIPAGTSF